MKTNPELILLVGPPASGKTTWARLYQSAYPDTLIVGRDKLREMLFGYTESTINEHYQHENFKAREDQVTVLQHTIIRAGLESGKSVIVDDTNCDADRIKKFSRDYDRYAFRYVPMSATLPECLERNKARNRQVNEDVIKKMFGRFEKLEEKLPRIERSAPSFSGTYQPDPFNPSAYLFDLDGTMANLDHRASYGCAEEEILKDTPIEPVVDMARLVKEKGFSLVFLSGREYRYEIATRQWLFHHLKTKDFALFMRRTGDYRKDSIIKRELFNEYVAPDYNVKAVFDDRKQVKQMWVDMGLFVFDCNQNDKWF